MGIFARVTLTLFQSARPRIFYPALILLLSALAFGGASRHDVFAPLLVLLTGVGVLGYVVWISPPGSIRLDRGMALILAGMLFWGLIQLVPLPPFIWQALPGRELAAEVDATMGVSVWRPISLVPERTVMQLLGLVAPIAAFVIVSQLDPSSQRKLLFVILAIALLSALLGLLQMGAGPDSALRFYRVTARDAAVGIFSNPNHHSLFLAGAIPIVFVWLSGQFRERAGLPIGMVLAAAGAVGLLAAAIVLTLSRTGMAFLPVAVAAGFALLPYQRIRVSRRIMALVAAVMVGGAAVAAVVLPRTEAMRALLSTRADDGRLGNVPVFVEMARDFFPFGSGYGSFDPVYRSYETLDRLLLNYLNQAHNEVAQIAIENGLPGMLLALALLVWVGRRCWRVWRHEWPAGETRRAQRAASVFVILAIVHSLVDYPLRGAGLSVVFAVAAAMLIDAPMRARTSSRDVAFARSGA